MYQKFFDLTTRQKKFLLSLYPSTDWVKRKTDVRVRGHLPEFVEYQAFEDYATVRFRKFKLKPSAIRAIETLLLSCGSESLGPKKGIALEKREWNYVKEHRFKTEELLEGFRELSERGEVPLEITDDWRESRKRVIVQDIDRAIANISVNIEWESNKDVGKKYLKMKGFSDGFVWLWVNIFDKLRKELREISYQQEFIIWDNS